MTLSPVPAVEKVTFKQAPVLSPVSRFTGGMSYTETSEEDATHKNRLKLLPF
jgi:hypothetical protein